MKLTSDNKPNDSEPKKPPQPVEWVDWRPMGAAEAALRWLADLGGAEGAADPHITCPKCHLTSYHPEDVRQRYCGNCHQFHADMQP
jgi:hypothetical protein